MTPFHNLDDSSLISLAASLRGGMLLHPTASGVAAHGPSDLAPQLAAYLVGMKTRGFTDVQIAEVMELIREERLHARRREAALDLVWTGPEPEKFTDRDAAVVLMEMFQTAQRSVLLSSFVVYDGAELFKALHERWLAVPDLEILLYLDVPRTTGDVRPDGEIIQSFKTEFRKRHWPWERLPKVYFDPRALSQDTGNRASLHAKVAVIDQSVTLITSANLTPKAQNRNVEAGVRIHSPSFARNVQKQFLGLVEHGLVNQVKF